MRATGSSRTPSRGTRPRQPVSGQPRVDTHPWSFATPLEGRSPEATDPERFRKLASCKTDRRVPFGRSVRKRLAGTGTSSRFAFSDRKRIHCVDSLRFSGERSGRLEAPPRSSMVTPSVMIKQAYAAGLGFSCVRWIAGPSKPSWARAGLR